MDGYNALIFVANGDKTFKFCDFLCYLLLLIATFCYKESYEKTFIGKIVSDGF